MRRINRRPFLFVFAHVAVGLLIAPLVFYAAPFGIALLAVLAAVLIGCAVVAAIKQNLIRLITVVFTFALVAGTTVFFLSLAFAFGQAESLEDGEPHAIVGRITEHCAYYGHGEFEAVLDSLMIDGQEVDGKMTVVVSDADLAYSRVACGYFLSFREEILSVRAIDEDGVHASSVRSDVRYSAYPTAADIFVAPGTPSALESVRLGLRDLLVGSMGDETGTVAYGMIAGDRYALDDEISDAFAGAGIGHILAVSGLHIGLIAALLRRLFRLLPLPDWVGRAATSLLLLLYLLFTGGSPSAVRAFVMCVVAIWAPAFGKTDRLNALCLAATVCLCICPFYLYEAGFLLSVSAVGGLLFFSRTFSRFLEKCRLPRKAADAVSASVSVQIMITPMSALFYHRLNLYSLPVNAVGMGALSAIFTLLVAVLPFALLFPVLLVPVGTLIGWMIAACEIVSALPLASIVVQVGVGVMFVPVLMFFVSRFVRVGGKKYVNLLLVCLSVAVGCAAENGLHETDALIAVGGGRTLTVVYRGSERYLFGELSDGRAVASALDRARVGEEVFDVCVLSLDEETASGIAELARLRKVGCVRFLPGTENVGLKVLLDAGIPLEPIYPDNGVFDIAYRDGSPCGWLYASDAGTAFIGNTRGYVDAMLPAEIVRCTYMPNAADYSDKLFLTAWNTSADNAVTLRYGNIHRVRFNEM